jgi:sugar O-acyltransferase (sialic acid O-acetyltransferase NeuD family)
MATESGDMNILLWGAGSQGRLVQRMLDTQGLPSPQVIFDPTLSQPTFASPAQFVDDPEILRELLPELTHYVVCVGAEHGFARHTIANALQEVGLESLTLIHETAFLEPTSSHGRGLLVMPMAVVHSFTSLGSDVVLNTGAVVDHECDIGDGVHIMGGAAIAGRVTIGDFASIGTNAAVLPDIEIGSGAIVGAGAVVTRDVPERSVVVGNPARFMREHQMKIDEESLRILRG